MSEGNSHPEGAPFEHYGPLQNQEAIGHAHAIVEFSVLRWPDAATVDTTVRRWAERVAAVRPELRRAGYFGSYARGDREPGATSIFS